MRLRSGIALALATVAIALGASAPSPAVPVRDVGVPNAHAAAVIAPPGSSTDHDGLGTPAAVLLAAGALGIGAACGFGGARISARRQTLSHPH